MGCSETDRPEVVEREVLLPAPPEEVWAELADPEELTGWLGDEVDMDPVPGGALRVEGPNGIRLGIVEDVVPGRRLAFWWTPTDGDGPPSFVELEVEPVGRNRRQTRLRVRETRVEARMLVGGIRRGPTASALARV